VIDVLFIQAQSGFGADSAVHALLMRYLDRSEFRIHVACVAGDGGVKPPSRERLEQIPELDLRPTHFAPSLGAGGNGRELSRLAWRSTLDLARLRSWARRNRIRIVHGSDRPRDAAYTVALARMVGAKSVVHVHVKWSHDYSAPSRCGVRFADACFGISEYVTNTIVATGKPLAQVHTVLNAIDESGWDPQLDGSAIRREFSVADDAPLIACVARLFSWKGQRELLRALALVHRRLPQARLLIVGADERNVGVGSFTEELRALASELGVADRVVFTGQRSDVPRIMAASDLFALPSFEEPFGLVFLEAMAMGRAIVAVDNGGTPEVVEHGTTGLLSPPWNIEALAENLVTLLEDPEGRARMGRAGRARLLERFTARQMADAVGRAYHAVLRS
jgi:glycosyltransferase involved in cell wall biosynthesis